VRLCFRQLACLLVEEPQMAGVSVQRLLLLLLLLLLLDCIEAWLCASQLSEAFGVVGSCAACSPVP
jgi:hypothetical protein